MKYSSQGDMTKPNTPAVANSSFQNSIEEPLSFKAIAAAEDKTALSDAVKHCETLGQTQDNKHIFLYRYKESCALMNEIGRLREESFRLVGEGTGLSRDIDSYDPYYDHIILWDDDALEVVGAYRLKGCDTLQISSQTNTDELIINDHLYTSSLFNFRKNAQTILDEGLELGRSFVQAKYWGSRSLEYLWYGIAAYLRQHPQYKFLFGAVSISSSLSIPAQSLLIHYYQKYYGPTKAFENDTIECKHPYFLQQSHAIQFEELFASQDRKASFLTLKKQMRYLGYAVPVLYKQYAELTEAGGTQFLGFNIDPDFSHCIDGFVVVDIDQMTKQKRKRYQLESHRVSR